MFEPRTYQDFIRCNSFYVWLEMLRAASNRSSIYTRVSWLQQAIEAVILRHITDVHHMV